MSESIKSLSVREQCRDKLPIFYGSVDNYYHGFKEVMANAIDEIINHFKSGEITITLFEDLKTISVEDTGRGVPINDSTDGIPNYELLFEKLFTGTNFENNNGENSKIATGCNGSGTCVLNHTSELFMIDSYYGGNHYQLKYIDGGERQYLKTLETSNKHGSKFTFKLDNSVYPVITYTYNDIKEIVRHCSATVGSIKFKLIYGDEVIEYQYETLDDYFESITNNLTSKKVCIPSQSFFTEAKILKARDGDYHIPSETNEVACIMSTSSNNIQETYLNANFLPEGGSINDGIIEGIRNVVLNFAKENKMLSKDIKDISKEDVSDSLCFLVKWSSTNVEFTNQTKYATKKNLYKKIAKEYINNFMEVYISEHKDDFKKLVEHILEITKFNNKSKSNKEALKKKLNEKIDNFGNRVNKLVDCKLHNEESEVFIAEGESAKGSIVLARNPKTQAVYPIRGKILNCLKASPDEVVKSPIITDLIKVLGCGVSFKSKRNKDLNNFDINKLRYGRVIIASDQDDDGLSIQALVLTAIYTLMRDLIIEGKVYIAQTPLFVVTELKTDKRYYAFNEIEKDKIISNIKGKTRVNRLKGLGEASKEDMYNTALNPETRQMIKVTVEDVEKMIDKFDMWMDEDVTRRKEFIINNLHSYMEDDE